MLIVTILYFILLVLKQENAVVVVTMLIIPRTIVYFQCGEKFKYQSFNLISRANKARHIKQHEPCKYKCRIDASVWTINNAGMKINVCVNVKN